MESHTAAKQSKSACGPQIAQAALQSIGMSTRKFGNPLMGPPEYALAVSLIFTKATHQAILLHEPPDHVCSTSILWSCLAHDKRFDQIPMCQASPGDILIEAGWQAAAHGYAGIVVDHGRIVSNSDKGVRDDGSLLEAQRHHRDMAVFRYVGFRNYYRSKPLANAGYKSDEPRQPAGQPTGGQWATGGATLAPSMPLVSGVNPAVGQEASPVEKGVAAPETPKNYYVNKTLRALQVRKPDGSVAIVKTKVKTQEQADLLGAPVGTEVPVLVPPGKDPQAMVDQWSRRKTKTLVDFAKTWRPKGDNDYKNKDSTSAIYDAYGNFEYGATGAAYGFTKGQVVAGGDAAALVQHHALNNPINRADIEAGHDAVSQGGKLQTVPYKWSPQARAN
jgi:hypothetical protein